jgi:hypothetical protein
MNFRYLLLLLLLPCMASSAQSTDTPECNTSFHDTLVLRALDAWHRPIEGAAIYVYYQYSGSVGSGGQGTYYSVGPLLTNSSGMVRALVVNIEESESLVDCNMEVSALAGGVNSTASVEAMDHPNIIDMDIPVYPVAFHVTDPSAAPLQGAIVWFHNETKTTDALGLAKFYAPAGPANYLVSYLDGKQQGSIQVTNDVNFEARIKFYPVTVKVMDDNGNPLNATLSTGTRTAQLGPNGTYYDPKIFGNSFAFNVSYAGVTKEFLINPETDNPKAVIFDFTSPAIGAIGKSEANGTVRLTVPVSDPGLYPSGVDPASISVTYRAESAAQWSRAVVFASQKGVFTADFPQFPPNTVIQFKVEAADLEGNKASLDGRFSTAPPPPEPVNTSNSTVTPPPQQPQGPGLPLLQIAGGLALLIFLIYMFFRLKKGGDS